MLDKDALQYLHNNLHPYEDASQLLLPASSNTPIVALAAGASIHSLENHLPQPTRTKAHADLLSSASFCDYVNRFKSTESSVYIDTDKMHFSAIFDHHGADSTAWGDHRATFSPKESIEWKGWKEAHGEGIPQVPFALMIERLLDTIHEPEPNQVLQAALDFQANENLVVGSTKNLENGATRFIFHKDNVSAKQVEFPHRIKLFMPIFDNEDSHFYDARVRYRVSSEGVLTFFFSFVKDPRAIMRDAIRDLGDKIRVGTSEVTQYEGRL